ncbi:MAG: dipeptidyl peptidase 3 [Planctomycetota bacterium]
MISSRKALTALLWAGILLLFAISSRSQAQDDLSFYVNPENVPVRALEARADFEALTPKEKLYAHWMARASWVGSLITWEQLSPESPDLLRLFQGIFGKDPVGLRREASRRGVSGKELTWLEQYAARCYSNCGNYLSFGDTKFVPKLSVDKFAEIAAGADSLGRGDGRLSALFESLRERIYSLEKHERSLGIGMDGVSAYYSENITMADLALVAAFMKEKRIEGWNTRVFKDDASGVLSIRFASALQQPDQEFEFRGRKIALVYGDYASILAEVVESFEEALKYVANDNQRRMVLAYINHFNGGETDDHKASQRFWVKDKGPAVETNVGFIETYRDPMGVRAEWEGLVAMVNKEQTKKFGALVESAPRMLPLLPWARAFEKDTFQRPDFTSLEVLCFANSGIPAGINIPNYDDIRGNFGFKNVSLGNVLRAGGKSTARISFLEDADQELYRDLISEAFEVQVGLHELLGHGSGKMFVEDAKGKVNFDRKLINPVTKKEIATWYKPGEDWGTQFTTIASSFEECRAEAVGLYLCLDKGALKVFGHEGEEANDIIYVNWLNMARAGMMGLTFYTPEQTKWRQAHMQGRFALLQMMLEVGDDLIKIYKSKEGDWRVHLNREAIETKGHPALADFLMKLNLYKATADTQRGRELYRRYTKVDGRFLEIRDYVLSKRKPRHLWVQPVTDLDHEGRAIMRSYPATYRGVIDSFLDRFDFLIGN